MRLSVFFGHISRSVARWTGAFIVTQGFNTVAGQIEDGWLVILSELTSSRDRSMKDGSAPFPEPQGAFIPQCLTGFEI